MKRTTMKRAVKLAELKNLYTRGRSFAFKLSTRAQKTYVGYVTKGSTVTAKEVVLFVRVNEDDEGQFDLAQYTVPHELVDLDPYAHLLDSHVEREKPPSALTDFEDEDEFTMIRSDGSTLTLRTKRRVPFRYRRNGDKLAGKFISPQKKAQLERDGEWDAMVARSTPDPVKFAKRRREKAGKSAKTGGSSKPTKRPKRRAAFKLPKMLDYFRPIKESV